MVDASVGDAFRGMSMLGREDTVGLEAVSEMRREWHKVQACLMEATVNNVVAHVGGSGYF